MKRCIFGLMVCLSLLPVFGFCETREIIAEGEYVMGSGETMAVAEERAIKKAEQNAAEQAGVFVKSYSKVQNLILAEDVIEVVANHAMKVSILDRKKSVIGDLDAIRFQVKIKAVMTTEEVEANLKKVREDRGVIDAFNRLKADYDRQAREMEILRKRLAEAGGDEKKKVLAEITNEEKRFKANLWLERAADMWPRDETVIKAYDKAIELNPALVDAYVGRAGILSDLSISACFELLDKGQLQCPEQLQDQQKALADLNRAIDMDKNNAEAFACRAKTYGNIKGMAWRIAYAKNKEDFKVLDGIKGTYTPKMFADIDRAIALKPDNFRFYDQRAQYYDPIDEIDKAIADATRAIALCRAADCGRLLHIYYRSRAAFYSYAGREELANKDKAASQDALMGERKGENRPPEGGELAKLQAELYPDVSLVSDETKRKEALAAVNQKIARNKGQGRDYLMRADLSDGKDYEQTYGQAIEMLGKGGTEGINGLLLVRAYLFKGLYDHTEKKYDLALKELQEAQAIIQKRLPHAITIMKVDDFTAIMAGTGEKAPRLSREEAEAFFWLTFAVSATTEQAGIYEEMGLPAKARDEYQYLCTTLKDGKACKDAERLR